MPRVGIVTDSVASIPQDLREALDIRWAALYIHQGAVVLRDLLTAHGDAFYEWLTKANELPNGQSQRRRLPGAIPRPHRRGCA